MSTTPGLAFGPSSISTTSGSWFVLPSGPAPGLGDPNANGQVLFFQGSFVKAKGGPTGITGTVLLNFVSNGVPGQTADVSFSLGCS